MNLIRQLIKTAIFLLSIVVLSLVAANFWIVFSSQEFMFSDVAKVPVNDVGLVLGTSKKMVGGDANPYFYFRMEAAAKLYEEKKVKHLIVSGDNRTQYYNEPLDMKKALVKLGVPDSAITMDYAGLSTLASIIRCKRIFGQAKFTVVTQRFHNHRALFIGRYFGLEAVGYNAQNVSFPMSLKVTFREYLARAKALIDLYIFNTQPLILGEKEKVNI